MLEKTKTFTKIAALLCTTLLLSATAFARGGDSKALEILETLQERYEESIEGIDDFVMVKDQHTVYHKKAYDNGRPYFKTRIETTSMDGAEKTSAVTDADLFSQMYSSIKEKATYEGTGEVDGHTVHILYVDKLEDLHDEPGVDDTIEDLRLYIDPGAWVLRQIEYTVEFEDQDGKMREATPVTVHSDFRDVEGMMIAYETTTIVSGLELSDEERRKAEESLREFEAKLADMPESQREMVKQMMGGQIEDYRNMLEKDQFETTRLVKEVRVNTGMEDF